MLQLVRNAEIPKWRRKDDPIGPVKTLDRLLDCLPGRDLVCRERLTGEARIFRFDRMAIHAWKRHIPKIERIYLEIGTGARQIREKTRRRGGRIGADSGRGFDMED